MCIRQMSPKMKEYLATKARQKQIKKEEDRQDILKEKEKNNELKNQNKIIKQNNLIDLLA